MKAPMALNTANSSGVMPPLRSLHDERARGLARAEHLQQHVVPAREAFVAHGLMMQKRAVGARCP